MNSFIDEIYQLALDDSVFENCRLMKANDFEKLNFPVVRDGRLLYNQVDNIINIHEVHFLQIPDHYL